MDGTELLNQMKASGIECEIVCAFSDHRLRGTGTTTLHRTSADQRMTNWGRNTAYSNHKSKAKKKHLLVSADHFLINYRANKTPHSISLNQSILVKAVARDSF